MMKDDIDHRLMLTEVEKGKHVYFDWRTKLHYYMKKQYLLTDRCDLALGMHFHNCTNVVHFRSSRA